MAIIIPSRNIYEIQNGKVKNNFFDNVSVDYKKIAVDRSSGTQVFSKKFDESEISFTQATEDGRSAWGKDIKRGAALNDEVQFHNYILASVIPYYYETTIYVDKKQIYSKIDALDTGVYENGNPKVSVSLSLIKKTGNAKIDVSLSNELSPSQTSLSFIEDETTKEAYAGNLEETLKYSVQNTEKFSDYSSVDYFPYVSSTVLATATAVNPSNLTSISVFEETTRYRIPLKLFVGCVQIKGTFAKEYQRASDIKYQITMDGEVSSYFATTATISINGTKTTLVFESSSASLGEQGSSNAIKFDEKSLIQETNKYLGTKNLSLFLTNDISGYLDAGWYSKTKTNIKIFPKTKYTLSFLAKDVRVPANIEDKTAYAGAGYGINDLIDSHTFGFDYYEKGDTVSITFTTPEEFSEEERLADGTSYLWVSFLAIDGEVSDTISPDGNPVPENIGYFNATNFMFNFGDYIPYEENQGTGYYFPQNYQSVLTEYANGKETATLLCDINDNYEYDGGEKVIGIDGKNKMSFDLYDEVIPMVWRAEPTYDEKGFASIVNKDVPISTYADGSPKVFKVIRVKPFYNGAVWQEIEIQEVPKK